MFGANLLLYYLRISKIPLPLCQQVKITDYLLRLLPYPFGIAYIPTTSESKQVSTNKVITNRFTNVQKGGTNKQKAKVT